MSDNEMSDKEKAGAEVGAAQTTKDIFGSDSEDSDSEEAPPLPSKPLSPKAETSTKPSGSSNDMKDIFGDDSDSDNESDKGDDVKQENSDVTMKVSDANDMDFLNDGETSQFKELKHAATHSKICISNTEKLQEDAATFSVKLPNFLKIQTKPYTKKLHHEEAESTLFPGATSMIRWRYKQNQNGDVEMDEKGQPVRESNARLVKWSDGSYQLIVGLEVFDSSTFPVSDSYLYAQRKSAVPQPSDPTYESISEEERDEIKTDTSLECVGAAAERIVLRPSSVVSAAHARLSLAIAEKYSRKTKIKDREYGNVIINAEKDTDARAAAINEEIRRAERRRRAQMDSSSSAPSRFAPSMSSRFMEEDDRYDNTSLNAIKKRGKAGNGRLPSHSSDEEEEDDEPDEEDNDFIVNDGDEDEEEDGDWGGRSDGSEDNNKRSAPKNDKTSKKSKKSILKDDTDSDQDDFETVKPKKRSQESEGADGNADDGEATSQKKRRRAIVDSSDDED